MNTKTTFLLICAGILYGGYVRLNDRKSTDQLILQNVEALTNTDVKEEKPKFKCVGNTCVCVTDEDHTYVIHGHVYPA